MTTRQAGKKLKEEIEARIASEAAREPIRCPECGSKRFWFGMDEKIGRFGACSDCRYCYPEPKAVPR